MTEGGGCTTGLLGGAAGLDDRLVFVVDDVVAATDIVVALLLVRVAGEEVVGFVRSGEWPLNGEELLFGFKPATRGTSGTFFFGSSAADRDGGDSTVARDVPVFFAVAATPTFR